MMENLETLKLIKWGEETLEKSGIECAGYDARLLMRYSADTCAFKRYIEKRTSRYPLQYILRETDFMGIKLKMEEGVFIPRQETELLIEKVLEVAPKPAFHAVNILEIGTGSGNIAISLTKNITNCTIIASDISGLAVKTAEYNAAANHVSGRIKFIKSDLFQNIPGTYYRYFDVIISNPPYVRRREIAGLQPEISYEDMRALDGGEDGCEFYRRILDEGRQYLKAGGIFAFEIGHDQGAAVTEIARQYPELGEAKIFKDYNGFDRIAIVNG